MAQLDTGLGWSAKDAWLVESANTTIANLQAISGALKLPIGYNDSTLYSNGLIVFRYTSTTGHTISVRFGVAQNSSPVYVSYATSERIATFISQTRNTTVYYLMWDENTGSVSVGTQTLSIWNTRDYPPWYFNGVSASSYTNFAIDAAIPAIYTTVAQICRNIVITNTPFVKTNGGYAVACLAKWRTDNNVLITTPVLISTKTENTDMTVSDTSYSLAKLNVRHDGVQFYMSFFDVVNKEISSLVEIADFSLFTLDLPQVFKFIAQPEMSNIQVTETVDPFHDFPYNGEDAGEINPDPQDDDVDFDDLPTRSFSTGGFCRIFNPDVSDLNDLASYMWTDQTFLQTVINHLKQILENPIEAIISLSLVPVQPPTGPTKVPVNVMFFNTGVTMLPVTSQFVTVDCGTTVLQESFGGALDYNPYTRVQMYLPYIGTVQLDTDEVMRKTLHLKYFVDVVTGICCAELKADDKLLYHFSGHCSVSQPITSADFSGYLNAAVSAAKLAVGVATGMAASTAAATAAQTPPAPSTPSSGSASTALVPVPESQALVPGRGLAPRIQEPPQHDNSKLTALWGELSKPGNLNTAAAAMGGKMVVQHSGGFSGNSGYLAKRRPYLIVTRPRIANPEEYGQHNGRPSMMYLNLGSCTGYTQVQSVHLTGFDATNPELSEISTLLKGGVIL